MHKHPKPFLRSYWVVPGKLLAGEYPGHQNPDKATSKMNALIQAGIRTIINLQEEDETDYSGNLFRPYSEFFAQAAVHAGITAQMFRFPITDNDIPDRNFMIKILDAIDQSISENQPVYVHCWGGKGRTGTVVGCYLIRHGIADPENVLGYLDRLRIYDACGSDPSPQTQSQLFFVSEWKKNL